MLRKVFTAKQSMAASLCLRAPLAVWYIMRYNMRKHCGVGMCGLADTSSEPTGRDAVGMMSPWDPQELLQLGIAVTGR
jgi:hypothetical protein